MLRAVALRLELGAITESSTPGTSSSARRSACRPLAWMPSSLVRRTFMGLAEDRAAAGRSRPPSPSSVADRLEVEAAGGRRVTGLRAGPAGEQRPERVEVVAAAHH